MPPEVRPVPDTRRQAERLAASYPLLWRGLVDGWRPDSDRDRAWLMFNAGLLFRTGGLRWAVDPVGLPERLGRASGIAWAEDLAGLGGLLLTHAHVDHFQPALLRTLIRLPFIWVVPEHLFPDLQREVAPSVERVRVAVPGETLPLGSLRITPFPGCHVQVPATGFLVETGRHRLLFPGDTRAYDAGRLPEFGPVDVLFANLWLGRGKALVPRPPLLESFVDFCLALRPRRIVLLHLWEVGRTPEDLWTRRHARVVRELLSSRVPGVRVDVPAVGGAICL